MKDLRRILTILDKPKDKPVAFKRAAEIQKHTGAQLNCVAFT